ncbi:RraA family protein [Salipiger thiooxidans]|uniref:RraA family protein n=1 Tax=Salipiger thiooxidans TaxID=282683 RepID=UPI001CD307D1|nr:RraA family protein [Salipiger thiooxidans]MCA0849779.1 RraA family protein [Salipiger thiooxidans]
MGQAGLPGFRIRSKWERPVQGVVARFAALPVANVSDVMGRMNSAGPALRPYHDGTPMCGPALTVRSRPGDNLMLHKAIDMAHPGDVIVCDSGGDITNAIMGELMLAHASQRQVGGFVIHGAIRDLDAIRAQSLPVFAIAVTHRGPYKDGPGEIGYPISLNGMTIRPGDIVMGDGDGVLAIATAEAHSVASAAEAKAAAEARQMEQTLANTLDRGWVDRVLQERGCTFETHGGLEQ